MGRGAGRVKKLARGLRKAFRKVAGAGHWDEARLQQEIEIYKDCENVHDLPAIFHYWSERYLVPKLQACGFEGLEDFFLRYIVDDCARAADDVRSLVSIGAGNCDFEIGLAGKLRERGIDNFHFECVEINPHMLERAGQLAAERQVQRHFTFREMRAARWRPEKPYAICIAQHSLHHIVELEDVFANIWRAIHPDGVFLTSDMIGRNGHMRWPEALKLVSEIWKEMPDRYKYNHQLKGLERRYKNWDCSKEGNEGIRAQDILPLLMETFHFEVFIAFANVISIFIDRGFGPNFDPEKEGDRAFIEKVARLDEEKLDKGEVKPTQMIAAMRSVPVSHARTYRHWTPEFCVRRPPGPVRSLLMRH